MIATTWTRELDLLCGVRHALYAPFTSSQVSQPLLTYRTQAVFSTATYPGPADSQQRAARAFMEALGGEIRPDAEAEQAFVAARAQRVRPAVVVRRRSSPPASRP